MKMFPPVVPLRLLLGLSLCLLALTGCEKKKTGPAPGSNGPVPYGTEITFGINGDASAILTSGWSQPEKKQIWSLGNTAVLTVPVPPSDQAVTLKMKLHSLFKEPDLPSQPVTVLVNGTKIADWEVRRTANFTAPIPEQFTKNGGTLTFTFKIPKAVSPKELGNSKDDTRALGICVFNFELSK